VVEFTLVLPIFALANAGVAWSADAFQEHGRLMSAITLGRSWGSRPELVIGDDVKSSAA
jgi:hypothetical protein